MDAIPDEIIVTVLSYLSPYRDFNSARLVCRKWNRVMNTIVRSRKREFQNAILNGQLLYIKEDRSVQTTRRRTPSHFDRVRGHLSNRQNLKNDGTEPNSRFSHNSCVIGRFLYIFGGCALSSSNAAFNDLHQFDLVEKKWQRLTINQGYMPAPRECSSMVVYENSLVIFGGWNSPRSTEVSGVPKFFNDTNIIDVKHRACNVIHCPDREAPSARAGHSACVVNDKMVVFGGAQRLLRYDDVWLLDMVSLQWSSPHINGKKPEARFGQSQFSVGDDHILIIGGCGGSNSLYDDVWLLNCVTWCWTEVKVDNKLWQPPDLWCHPMVKVGDTLVTLSDQNICNGCMGFQRNPLENNLFAGPVPIPSVICARCKQNKVKKQNFDSNFQLYVLDTKGVLMNEAVMWNSNPSFVPQTLSRSRSLFSLAVGRAELLLFGGVYNMERVKINSSTPSGLLIVKGK